TPLRWHATGIGVALPETPGRRGDAGGDSCGWRPGRRRDGRGLGRVDIGEGGRSMTGVVDLYYDPFDFEIDDDPYPVWKRMRDEAPLYYNEKHNFYALSRYDDVARGLPDWETYRSARGTTAEAVRRPGCRAVRADGD